MELNLDHWTIEQLSEIIERKETVSLSEACKQKIASCREYLDGKLERATEPVYGVNTGFGALYDRSISEE
ncbi:MAG: aromatic amino acid lyase, partial [Flavobacteriales bacterium]|nr:aromatic amino acid lyase [Flavobacteriales bacterium]